VPVFEIMIKDGVGGGSMPHPHVVEMVAQATQQASSTRRTAARHGHPFIDAPSVLTLLSVQPEQAVPSVRQIRQRNFADGVDPGPPPSVPVFS